MSQEIVRFVPQEYSILPNGTTDDMLISMWLHDAAKSTKEAYRMDIEQFRNFVNTPLQRLTLQQLQEYKDALDALGFERATIARKLKSVKSLLTFAKETGYTPFNIGKMLRVPKLKNELAERLLTEEEILSIIFQEKQHNRRNYVLLRTLYATGARVSEICRLQWKDIQPRGETGQVTLFGKGDKTRFVLLKPETYKELTTFRHEDAQADDYVFASRGRGRGAHRQGDKLDPSQVYRIIEQAAIHADVETFSKDGVKHSRVSPHWFRHAHATHAMDRGAPIALIRDTLGHDSIETTSKYAHAHPDKSSAQFLNI